MAARKIFSPYPKYRYVFNKGVKNQDLFPDKDDLEVFLNYLRQSLTPQPPPKDLRQTFTVKGRTFKGIPHQPKNFFGKIELVAYDLKPKYFQIVFTEIEKGSLSKLMRALSTRYAIYFNKKYHRKGSIFSGPYRSSEITESTSLILLTHLFHHGSAKDQGDDVKKDSSCTSYKDYIKREPGSFVKPETVISVFGQTKNSKFKKYPDYEKFVTNYEPNETDQKTLSSIITDEVFKKVFAESGMYPVTNDLKNGQNTNFRSTPHSNKVLSRFMFSSVAIFVLLFSVGFRNVIQTNASGTILSNPIPAQKEQVQGTSDDAQKDNDRSASGGTFTDQDDNREAASSTPDKDPANRSPMVFITINDGSDEVNIRENPSASSPIITKAKAGDAFRYISLEDKWYKIGLEDGKTAFVSDHYANLKD